MVDAARRLRAGAADRRAHRLGAERRLARRLPERPGGRRGAAADRRGGHAAADRAARQLGRRGGRALRPLALRLLGGRVARWATRTSCGSGATRTASRCPTRCASTASTSTARSRRARSSRMRPRISSCTSSRGRCSSRSTCRSAPCSGRSASSATRSVGAARPRTPARRRWTSAATRSPARRSSRSRSARSRREVGDGAVCTLGRRRAQAGHRHLGRRDGRAAARPAAPRRAMSSRGCSHARGGSERFAQEEDIEVEWERIWSIEPILFDEALIELADESIREVGRHVAPAAERAAARRRRGRARGRADSDGVRPEPARPLAHEARGHEGGASRAAPCRRSTAWPTKTIARVAGG